MISVSDGTGDICFAYNIPFGDDIRLRRMNGTDIISYCDEGAIYHAAKPYIISRSDISLTGTPYFFIIFFG